MQESCRFTEEKFLTLLFFIIVASRSDGCWLAGHTGSDGHISSFFYKYHRNKFEGQKFPEARLRRKNYPRQLWGEKLTEAFASSASYVAASLAVKLVYSSSNSFRMKLETNRWFLSGAPNELIFLYKLRTSCKHLNFLASWTSK